MGLNPNLAAARHFTNVLGVFQGGGVRGPALAGAYAEAVTRGVRFNAVAGTSAGAIIAALVAAGATPAQLYTILQRLDFKSLIVDPVPSGRVFAPSRTMSWASRLLRIWMTKVESRFLTESGMYSSERIEQWVEEALREILGRDPHGPAVQFRDLVLPLYVVAANLRTRRVHVWSTQRDPTKSVASAVRCSANIPLFFQPVAADAALYVDGGPLSNLPTFVYQLPEAQADLQSTTSRILAFRLVGEPPAEDRLKHVKGFLEALSDTQTEGNIGLDPISWTPDSP